MTGYEEVAGRSLGLCERCGRSWGEQMHHRQARGMGGSKIRNGAENLLHLCGPCHWWVEAHPRESYDHGWKVRRGLDPAEVPVTYRGVVSLLTPEGVLEWQQGKELE